MNTLERLAAQNQDNYLQYLDRMSESCATTSKHLIPFYTIGCNTILDVGCADGTLMKNIKEVNPFARVIGIDLNQTAVDKAAAAGLEVYHMSLEEVQEKLNMTFDCIIFSSVLHEISSYAEEKAFTATPIYEAIQIAYSLLKTKGYIIIRDGLQTDFDEVKLQFDYFKDVEWFEKFIKESSIPYIKNEDFYVDEKEGYVLCSYSTAQDFLAVWTWGKDSWHREIKEKFCILPEEAWHFVLFQTHFDTIAFFKSKESYPKYLNHKVKILRNGTEIFPYMTCTIIAQKT